MSYEYEQEMETVMGIGCLLALGYTSSLQVLAKVLYRRPDIHIHLYQDSIRYHEAFHTHAPGARFSGTLVA
jgi:predicted transcriptional regulator